MLYVEWVLACVLSRYAFTILYASAPDVSIRKSQYIASISVDQGGSASSTHRALEIRESHCVGSGVGLWQVFSAEV